jgi:hypothetical protein
MVSRLIALPLQVIVAWFATPFFAGFIQDVGGWELFVQAVICAMLVWLVGVFVSEVMQADLPSSGTMIAAVSLATVGAAVCVWLPALIPPASPTLRRLPDEAYPLIGALLGYQIDRSPSRVSG